MRLSMEDLRSHQEDNMNGVQGEEDGEAVKVCIA